MDPFHADLPPNYDLSLEEEENNTDITSDTSLTLQCQVLCTAWQQRLPHVA
jgi:hypothetical protein